MTITLADPTGPFAVGATTFTLPVPPRRIGSSNVRTKSSTKLEPALLLDEVTFTAFYPTSPRPSKQYRKALNWLPRQLCTHLASSGKVVLALEHHDGTGPFFQARFRSPEGAGAQNKLYIQPEDVVWDKGAQPEDSNMALRAEQLEFRRREVYTAYRAFRGLVDDGERGALQSIDGPAVDWESWKGIARCDDNIALAGHSFGGATVFDILSNPPPDDDGDDDASSLPISHALALDPWLEPIPSPGPQPLSSARVRHPKMLVINSEGFTLWKEHFDRLQDIVRAWDGGRLLTFVGARHVSFSDYFVLLPPPLRKASAYPMLHSVSTVAQAFLDDALDDALQLLTLRKMEMRWVQLSRWCGRKTRKRKLVGDTGDVVVH
ncbi:hypothetical protein EW146_g7650 [Bondarzewia mesenterica]|uniref:1-alkyl-2-acetylglycerophosphocholine esterase n=1 Tax=Bondarzewia mesenterica TaxID=1095465 RepID=A0A4S4LKT3_9AGAM|nr:hypothetical protein EW146_g7650 [Bondarzewia mesenterica]